MTEPLDTRPEEAPDDAPSEAELARWFAQEPMSSGFAAGRSWERLRARFAEAPGTMRPPPERPESEPLSLFDPRRQVAAKAPKVGLQCRYCHDDLPRWAIRYCASCLAPHHAECFAEHGRCSVLGCEEVATVRPSIEDSRLAQRRSRAWAAAAGFVGALLGGAAWSAFTGDGAPGDGAPGEVPREEVAIAAPVDPALPAAASEPVLQRRPEPRLIKRREPPKPAVSDVLLSRGELSFSREGPAELLSLLRSFSQAPGSERVLFDAEARSHNLWLLIQDRPFYEVLEVAAWVSDQRFESVTRDHCALLPNSSLEAPWPGISAAIEHGITIPEGQPWLLEDAMDLLRTARSRPIDGSEAYEDWTLELNYDDLNPRLAELYLRYREGFVVIDEGERSIVWRVDTRAAERRLPQTWFRAAEARAAEWFKALAELGGLGMILDDELSDGLSCSLDRCSAEDALLVTALGEGVDVLSSKGAYALRRGDPLRAHGVLAAASDTELQPGYGAFDVGGQTVSVRLEATLGGPGASPRRAIIDGHVMREGDSLRDAGSGWEQRGAVLKAICPGGVIIEVTTQDGKADLHSVNFGRRSDVLTPGRREK